MRTRYLRTNAFYDPNSLQYAPPHFSVYDKRDRRFFVSNPFLNRIDVFDAINEVQINSIPVPGAWGIDISADFGTMYAATLIGDVYQIDPAAMQISRRFPSAGIGPAGFEATEAFIMADGKVALLGAMGGLSVDGENSFAVWNPADNSIDIQGNGGTPNSCIFNMGAFSLSGDRRKVLWGSIDSDGTLCSYDPSTQQTVRGTFGGFLSQILPTPDGSRFFVTSEGGGAAVYDVASLQQLGTIVGTTSNTSPPYSLGMYGAVLSFDGSTLYAVDSWSGLTAYDTTTLAMKGWVPNFLIPDLQTTLVPGAADETGLIIGPIGHGVSFVDASKLETSPAIQIGLGFPTPSTGQDSGGTSIQVSTSSGVQNLPDFPGIRSGYLGNIGLEQLSSFSQGSAFFPTITGNSPPVAQNGPADFTVVFTNQNVGIMPEGFSYGPAVLEVVPNASTAEGGGTGTIIGYGLGQKPSDVQIAIGGKPANVTAVYPNPPFAPYPFPIQAVQFTIPAGGNAVSTADVSVASLNGSVVAPAAFEYIPAVTTFPLSAPLQAGVYDSHRGRFYFTSATQIQTLSLQNGWGAPITLPNLSVNSSLLALSLSPDGSLLAVSDFGGLAIYVLNPDNPSSVRRFSLSTVNVSGGFAPVGLAVTSSGVVYFATQNINGTGGAAFHKLNTATSTITDFPSVPDGGLADHYIRVLLSPDGRFVYLQVEGIVQVLNTSNDSIRDAGIISSNSGGNPELCMSADGSTLGTNGYFADGSLSAVGMLAYQEWETWFASGTPGQKLNANGTLFFQPLTDGIDVLSVATGRLLKRVVTPVQIANVYDGLVVDDTDNSLAAITTSGVAIINLNTLNALQNTPAARSSRNTQDLATRSTGKPGAASKIGKHVLRPPRLAIKNKG